MQDNKYLKLRGRIYHLNYRTPKELLSLIGKPYIQHSLETDSLKIARRKRDVVISKINAMTPLDERDEMLNFMNKIQIQYDSIKTRDDELVFDEMHEISEDTMKDNPVWTNAVLNVTSPNSSVITISSKESFKTTTKLYLEAVNDKSTSYLNRTKLSSTTFVDFSSIDLTSEIPRRKVSAFVNHLLESKSVKTTRNYLSCLGAIWAHAYDREEAEGTNPFINQKIYKKEVTKSYKPFTLEQWKIYYPALINSATTKPRALLVAIALLTGMRLNEILGLDSDDIRQEPTTGIWYIDLKPNANRTLKTASSERMLPIHELILADVLALKKASPDVLFPEVRNINTNDKSSNIAKWLNGTRKRTITSTNQSFHSLRGMFSTALERGGVTELTAMKFIGHRVESLVFGTYSDGAILQELKEALDKAVPKLEGFTNVMKLR